MDAFEKWWEEYSRPAGDPKLAKDAEPTMREAWNAGHAEGFREGMAESAGLNLSYNLQLNARRRTGVH